MSPYYLTLDDYLAIAVELTGQSVQAMVKAANTAMADSALHQRPASPEKSSIRTSWIKQPCSSCTWPRTILS